MGLIVRYHKSMLHMPQLAAESLFCRKDCNNLQIQCKMGHVQHYLYYCNTPMLPLSTEHRELEVSARGTSSAASVTLTNMGFQDGSKMYIFHSCPQL